MPESIVQPYVDAQIARHATDTFADLVALLDAHAATTYPSEAAYLDAWLETQWAYWAIARRCETDGQRARFEDMAVSCGFVLLG